MNKTKIIATIGPSCSDINILQEMVNSGVGTFRINMSHGDSESKKQLFDLIKSVKHPEGGRPAILADLCGPKIRIINISDKFELQDGDSVVISNKEGSGDIFVTSSISLSNVITGSKILINDGKVQLEVDQVIDGNSLRCKTLIGGDIQKGKGVNFPGVSLGVPALTDQDKEDLKLALNEESDWIALSFVRNASDIDGVHEIMNSLNIHLPVMAKIDVNGENEEPLFTHLKSEQPGIMGSKKIKWNFTKFLVDQNGKVLYRFAPKTTPAEIEEKIKSLL